MTANETFERCWNNDPADISTAWFRAAESLKAFGHPKEAQVARINYIKSLPVQLSNETMISVTGEIIDNKETR